MIKYRYTEGNASIETLDVTTIPEGLPYETIEFDPQTEELEEQKAWAIQEAIAKQKAMVEQLNFETIVNQQQTLPDEDAIKVQAVYPLFIKEGKEYKKDEKCQDFDENNELSLYKCIQPITSQPQFPPRLIPAHFVKIDPPGTIGVWRPYAGAVIYGVGSLAHYPTKNDPIYRSTVPNNVWRPGEYGWVLHT